MTPPQTKLTRSLVFMLTLLAGMVVASYFVYAVADQNENNRVESAPVASPIPVQVLVQQSFERLEAQVSGDINVSDWQYMGPQTSVACHAVLFETADRVSSGPVVSLQNSDYGSYYCFRALTPSGEYIYKSHLVQ